MAKGKRDYAVPAAETVPAAEDVTAETFAATGEPLEEPPEAPLPVGLKELDPKESTLKDGWELRDGLWVNLQTFNIPGGIVPQGVSRNTEEAYALEMQRRS